MKIMKLIGYAEMILLASICFLFLHLLNKKTLVTHWPVVGMLPSLFRNVHQVHNWLTELLSKNHGTFVFKGPWFTNINTVLFTSDPANLRHIFATNFSNYPKGPEYKEVFDVLGDGILNADSDLWKTQRQLAHKFVNHDKFLKFLVQTIRSKVENALMPVLEHALEENLVIDLQDVFKRLMLDTSISLALGSDPGCLSIGFSKSPYSEAVDDVEEAVFYRHVMPGIWWKLQRLLGIGKERKHRDGRQLLDQLVAFSIATRRKETNSTEKDEKCMDLLRSYMDEDEAKSDKFLRDSMITFIGAGASTVSSAVTWFFWLISQNPVVENKILEEIQSKAVSFSVSPQGKTVKTFNTEGLEGLVYLHGALCEVLRLYPPVPFNHKRPVKPDILPSGHRVNSRTRIMPIFYSVGRMEEVWGEDCLEFKPERWIAKDGTIQVVPPDKFISFGLGPRTCIGKKITFSKMRMVAATVLYNYHVEVVDGHSISPKNSMVLDMKHGMKARIRRRVQPCTGNI